MAIDKNQKKLLFWLVIFAVLAFFMLSTYVNNFTDSSKPNDNMTTSNASNNFSNNTSTTNSSQIPKSTGPAGINESELKKATQATKSAFRESGVYEFDDMSVSYNQSNNEITVIISVLDTTKGLYAKKMAETTLKRLNEEVRVYNSSIKPHSTTYYGGLYDECNLTIMVVPKNNMYDSKYWYISQYMTKGTHRNITLKKMYASGSMYI
ncbi:hypothetical protein MmiEs2_08280 [Methanimicrococcus stummii]|uniref:Uncharacterized protein n=1 Tax=Methanimicrococcus stummii TaxID=3028294 RepID=A0AA97A838_9EURY|nr:hypothetical protein [Methanimicrococcus sp. Es2]WNY28628.1 hypothetical protein MmiEs2_08280 [Methanimicrococcus sp. Es2]